MQERRKNNGKFSYFGNFTEKCECSWFYIGPTEFTGFLWDGFSKVMSASLQNAGQGEKDSFGVSGDSVTGTTAAKQNNNVAKQDKITTENKSDAVEASNEGKLKEDISKAVSDIKDKIKEAMDVSDEDIENAMEQLGIGIADLLNPQIVTDLVVTLSGNSDSLEFLTDASAVAALEDILNAVKEITQNLTETYNVDITSVKDIVKDLDMTSDKNTVDYQDDRKSDDNLTADTAESITDVIAEKTAVKGDNAATDEKRMILIHICRIRAMAVSKE